MTDQLSARLANIRRWRAAATQGAVASDPARNSLHKLLSDLQADEFDYFSRAAAFAHGTERTLQQHQDFPCGMIILKPLGPTCNVACDYCYQLNITEHPERAVRYGHMQTHPRMSMELIEKLCKELAVQAAGRTELLINWHGGEPMLAGIPFYEQALALFERHIPASLKIKHMMQTNGTLINDKWLAFLKQNKFAVTIAVDGPESSLNYHRRFRSDKGETYPTIIGALKMLQAEGIPFSTICVFAPGKIPQAQLLLEFMLEHGLQKGLGVKILPSYSAAAEKRTVQGAYGEYLKSLFECWLPTYAESGLSIANFIDPLRGLLGLPLQECYINCGDRLLCFETNGDAWLCSTPFTNQEYRFGNLAQQSLASILQGEPRHKFLAKRHALLADCRATCSVFNQCWGSCSYHVTLGKDDRFEGKTYYCQDLKAFYSYLQNWLDSTLAEQF